MKKIDVEIRDPHALKLRWVFVSEVVYVICKTANFINEGHMEVADAFKVKLKRETEDLEMTCYQRKAHKGGCNW